MTDPQQQLSLNPAGPLAGWRERLADVALHGHQELLQLIRHSIRRHKPYRRPFPVDAEDIGQEVYLSLWRAAQAPQLVENPLAYLQRLIDNEVRTQWRRWTAGRRHVQMTRRLDERHLPRAARRRSLLDLYHKRELVRQAVRQLDPSECQLVLLRTHGASWQEIAGRLRRPREGSRTEYRRALRRLRRRMASILKEAAGEAPSES